MGTQLNTTFAFDAALQLDDGATPKTATGYGSVAAAPLVFDTMAGAPALGLPPVLENIRYQAVAVVAVSVVSGTTPSDTVTIQGSNDPTFATGVVTLASTPAIAASGTYTALINNEQGTTKYRYLRSLDTISGTTPSFTRVIFLAPLPEVI